MKGKNNQDTSEKEMSFFDHIDELRGHLFRSIIAVLIFAIVAFLFKNIIFDAIILAPKEPAFITNRILCLFADRLNISRLCINEIPLKLINIKIAGQFVTHIKISFISGFIVAFPYVVWEIWRFVRPALFKKERIRSRSLLLITALLFFMGVLLGYFIIVPLAINFLNNYIVSESVDNTINLGSYISTMTSICFAAGLIFELPIISFLLTKFGLLTPSFMKQYRKHSIIAILLLSAIITPPDMISQLLIGIPLFFLYEISIYISKVVIKKKQID